MKQSFQQYYTSIKATLLGIAVGDALGVPSEFTDRQSLLFHPVSGMMGYGTHNQPPGTWSDDSALTFCLAEAIADGFDLDKTATNFVKWLQKGFWTPYRQVFDISLTTQSAIKKLAKGKSPLISGDTNENSNSNGSLMRIMPLIYILQNKPLEERFEVVRQVSAITHAHIRSVIACFYYVELSLLLMDGMDKFEAYRSINDKMPGYLEELEIPLVELKIFRKVFEGMLENLSSDEIVSDGYVLHTLETSVWCFLNTDSYTGAVLKAINLGADTDTNGAVTGGLAALYYGLDSIPEKWLRTIARRTDIEYLAYRMAEKLSS